MANIKYESSNGVIYKMLDDVAEMERILKNFKTSTILFQEKIDDEISQSAVELVEHLSEQISKLREAIEGKLSDASLGMSKLAEIEKNRPRRVRKI